MLAKMALQLNHATCEKLQSFQGMLVTGVRFIFNKFPPSNMKMIAFTPHNHGIPWDPMGKPHHMLKALDR